MKPDPSTIPLSKIDSSYSCLTDFIAPEGAISTNPLYVT